MKLLQSIGVVFTLMVIVAIAIMAMYLSYILGIGILLAGLVFIIYHVLKAIPDKL